MLFSRGIQISVSQHAAFSFAEVQYIEICERKICSKGEVASALN